MHDVIEDDDKVKSYLHRVSRALTGEVGLSSARAAKKLKRRKRTNR